MCANTDLVGFLFNSGFMSGLTSARFGDVSVIELVDFCGTRERPFLMNWPDDEDL